MISVNYLGAVASHHDFLQIATDVGRAHTMFTGHMERVRPVFMLRKLALSAPDLHRPIASPFDLLLRYRQIQDFVCQDWQRLHPIVNRPGLAAPEFSFAGGEQIKNCTRFCTDFLHPAQTEAYWLFCDDSG